MINRYDTWTKLKEVVLGDVNLSLCNMIDDLDDRKRMTEILYDAKDKKSGKPINVNEEGLGIKYIPSNDKGDQIILKPGDMLVYEGAKFEHWREPFTGTACIQLFLHYVEDNKKNKKRLYDSRPHLGLDSYFKGAIINDR